MKDSVFRDYDIRGIYGKDFDSGDAEIVGKAFGSLIGPGKIVVGRDIRATGRKLSEKLIDGLLSTGCDVINLGIVPTSAFNYAIKKLKVDGGVCVTASHNPSEYNGFKFKLKNTVTFSGEKIQQLKKKIDSGGFKTGKGKLSKKDIMPQYSKHLKRGVKLKKKIRLVIDCGNGTCSSLAPKILEEIGCNVLSLYCTPNSRFPNHLPDPSKDESLATLRKRVVENKADVGIAFDNDGDRIGFVDDKGNIVRCDIAMIFLVKPFLKKGAKFVHDIKFSRAFIDFVKENGAKPIMERTGYPHITKRMIKEKSKVAGEFSGHFYYLSNGSYSDGLFTGIKFLEQLSKSDKPLSKLVEPYTKYYSTKEMRIKIPEYKMEGVIEKLKTELKKMNYRMVTIDGIRVEFEDGWALVRASHTEPVLSVRFEAMTKHRLEEIRDFVLQEISLLK